MRILRIVILIFVLLSTFNIGMKGQSFNCFISNDTLISPNVYQFDIYLEATSANFFLRAIGACIQFDSAFFPSGATITASKVAGSSQLISYFISGIQFNQTYSCLSIPLNAVTSCLGAIDSSNNVLFMTGMGPRRISSYRITSSIPFNNVLPKPSMIRPQDSLPGPGTGKMSISKWSPYCAITNISSHGEYTNFSAHTLINQIHDLSLYVPTLPNVIGEVFYDANTNCQRDSFEITLNHINISCQLSHYTQTQDSGKYYFYLPDGNYQLQCGIPVNWMQTCANNNVSIINGVASNLTSFGLMAMPGVNDLAIDFTQPSIRSHRDFPVIIHYQNLGTTIMDGTIHFEMDTIFTFVSSTIAPDTIYTHSLSWNFTNLLAGEDRQISFILHCRGFPTNTPFINTAHAWSVAGDAHLSDNLYSISDSIRGSIDPNEKYVQPKGFGSNGAITPADSMLSYRIAFQNTGSDTAFYVMVVDTLDGDLDPLTFRIGAISAPCDYTLSSTSVLKFVFDPCALPDSTTDELNSHGFINYFIETKPNLPDGTIIENTANIYFDYNLPIATNTTINTIDYFLSNKEINSSGGTINVYPNPTDGYFRFELPEHKLINGTAVVIDQTGRVMQRMSIHSDNGEIDLGNYSPGVYTIVLVTDDGSMRSRVVVY